MTATVGFEGIDQWIDIVAGNNVVLRKSIKDFVVSDFKTIEYNGKISVIFGYIGLVRAEMETLVCLKDIRSR